MSHLLTKLSVSPDKKGDSVVMTTYIHTHIHTYKQTYIHTYIHTYIQIYIHTYICTYMHTCTHACNMETCIHTYMHVCIHHPYIRMYVHNINVCNTSSGPLYEGLLHVAIFSNTSVRDSLTYLLFLVCSVR